MCLGIPAKVLSIEGSMATVEVGGASRNISIMLIEDVSVGDWVVVHAGYAIQKVNEEEAMETLRLLKEISGGD